MSHEEWKSTILSRFPGSHKSGKGYLAICPAHEDSHPSLTLYFTDKKVNITCKAGCSWENILSAAGMEKRDVYYHENGFHPRTSLPKKQSYVSVNFAEPTQVYSYTDESGQELYQNCRYEMDKTGKPLDKKTFRQRQKQGNSWAYSLNGCRRVPYKFPSLIAEPNLIFDCEGEKDAENLIKLGLTATTTLKEAFAELPKYCKEKGIVICEDNDEPGRKKAKEKAEAYWKSGATFVKIWTFRDMPEGSDVSDWLKIDTEQKDVFAIDLFLDNFPEYNPLQDITIDFLREVTERKPLIRIDARNALPSGNLGGIVAGIGVGKSHFCEIIASNAIHPGCEEWGLLDVQLQPGERIAILDTEQPGDDCKEILYRIFRRTGQQPSDLTEDKKEFKRLSVMSLIELEFLERREKLEMVIKRHEYKLIIIDGLLDFCSNPNDPAEAAGLVLWLHSMAAKYDKGIFCVIHGNRNDLSGKGKGWLGDVFQRKASCFLMVRKHKTDPSIRVVTTEFDNVKFRHADDTGLNIAMQWDTELRGFRCIPYPEEDENKLTPLMIFEQCFQLAKNVEMRKKKLVTFYCQITGKSTQTAYREIEKATGVFLHKEKLYYSLIQDATE